MRMLVDIRRTEPQQAAGQESRKQALVAGGGHIRTRPYTPRTNGKAERFIQTALREWAYAQAYPTSERRAAELPVWLHRYNWHSARRDAFIRNYHRANRWHVACHEIAVGRGT